jgi:DHA1 family bicyclomycin/chloramphenicol resistance-like MFS transporter
VGFFLYVAAAPVFVIQYLNLSQEQFGWLFIPAMSGVMLGSYLSGKVAKKLAREVTIRYGYVVMLFAVAANLTYNALSPPVVPWVILPVMLYTTGMSLAMPGITLLTLDLFPSIRGMAASMQGFIQTMVMTFVSGVIAPLLADSGMKMALGVLVLLCASYLAWCIYIGSLTANLNKKL